jgi:hypothetical protein
MNYYKMNYYKVYSKEGYREIKTPLHDELIIPSEARWNNDIEVSDMKDKCFSTIAIEGNDTILFIAEDYIVFMYHSQDCCESVEIDDVVGDWKDLIDSPLLIAEEVSSENMPAKDPEWDKSYTWTFYKFATAKGYVDIKWYGVSNGYYSERVDLCFITEDKYPNYFEALRKCGII